MNAMTLRTGCTPFQAPQMRTCRVRTLAAQATSDPLLAKPAVRPSAPSLAADAPVASSSTAAAPIEAASSAPSGTTVEYQRQQAKAMQKYFQSLKFAETVDKAKVFGWSRKNEITNGRWVMMGWAIGLMTEYATGKSFIDQFKLMASYMGLVDMD